MKLPKYKVGDVLHVKCNFIDIMYITREGALRDGFEKTAGKVIKIKSIEYHV